ncbi:hypothetical protein [Methylobacterium sp. sgz302541]|uniref:DUF7946 domain-containing protein n=1 Tax=unclassified Methylobacterium TaxID=2615210 RepID=UPI003D3458D3
MSDVYDAEIISIIYDGGLATSGQLKFYEFSRASYGFARMITTIEHFRRTGNVAQRISRKNYVDVIIKAPERGSFPIDILIPIAHQIAQEAPKFAHIPIKIFIKYIMDSVKGLLTKKQENEILELTKIFLKNEKERTEQSRLETDRVQAIRDMNRDSNVTAQAAIDVIDSLLKNSDARIGYTDSSAKSMNSIRNSLSERIEREKEFQPYKNDLSRVGSQKMAKLTRKVRPQIAEIGLPLRNSAETVKFSAESDRKTFATFDKDSIADVNSRTIDDKSTVCEVRFISYDKDLGSGKLDIADEDIRRLSYSLPYELKYTLQKKSLNCNRIRSG